MGLLETKGTRKGLRGPAQTLMELLPPQGLCDISCSLSFHLQNPVAPAPRVRRPRLRPSALGAVSRVQPASREDAYVSCRKVVHPPPIPSPLSSSWLKSRVLEKKKR